jgi:hypothetical protein
VQVLGAVAVVLAVFCSFIGYRMLLNKPNKGGSILPPSGWYVIAFLFFSRALFLLFEGLRYSSQSQLIGALCAGAVAVWCFRAGRQSLRRMGAANAL